MIPRAVAATAGLSLLLVACGSSGVPAADLAPIVERDGVAFDLPEVPDEVLDRLAESGDMGRSWGPMTLENGQEPGHALSRRTAVR